MPKCSLRCKVLTYSNYRLKKKKIFGIIVIIVHNREKKNIHLNTRIKISRQRLTHRKKKLCFCKYRLVGENSFMIVKAIQKFQATSIFKIKRNFLLKKKKGGNLPKWFSRALSIFFCPSIGKVEGMMINVASILGRIVTHI